MIIGISGGSGSGKTTILRSLRDSFSEGEVCIISQDDYYKKRELQQTDPKGIKNFDLPSSFEKEKMVSDLECLLSGRAITLKEYVFNNESKNAQIKTIKPAPVFIIEGLFIFHFKELSDLFDVKVFVHAKDNLKVIRRIKRDRIERNYPIEDVLYRYEYHVAPTFEKYILPYKDDCHIIINNNDDYKIGLEFLKALITVRLQEIAGDSNS